MILTILVALSALSQVDRSIIALLVEPISRDLGVDDFQISLLQGIAFGLFYSAFGIPFGIAADRWSRRWIIFGGIVIWSLAAAACGLANTYNQLLAARFVVGAGEAALLPCAYSLISDIFPKHRLASALAVFSIGSAVGTGVSKGLGGLLVDFLGASPVTIPLLGAVEPWQAVFIITGAPGVLLAFLIFLVPDPGRRTVKAADASWRAVRTFVWDRRAVLACHFLGFSMLAMLTYGSGSWVPTLLVRRYDLTAGLAGTIYGLLMCVTTIIGMLSMGPILDTLFRKGVTDAPFRIFVWCVPVMTALTVAAAFMPNPVGFLVLVGLAQFGICVAAPAATALQLFTPAQMRGRISSLYILTFNLVGFSMGPSLIAALTVYVFKSPDQIHLSIATSYAIVAPMAWLLFLIGLRPLRTAMERAA